MAVPGTGTLRHRTFQKDSSNSPPWLHFQVARLSGLETKIFGASNTSLASCPCQQPGSAPAGLMQQIFGAASTGWRRISIVLATASLQLISILVRFGFDGAGFAAADRWLWWNRCSLMPRGKHEKPVGAMGFYPTREFYESNPGAQRMFEHLANFPQPHRRWQPSKRAFAANAGKGPVVDRIESCGVFTPLQLALTKVKFEANRPESDGEENRIAQR